MTSVSVCIATHNKRPILDGVLETIFSDTTSKFEVIVVDDASTDGTETLREKYPIKFMRITRPPGYRNPAVARNVAMKMSRADILVLQSDDVRHIGPVIPPLSYIAENTFNVGTVWNVFPGVGIGDLYTGLGHQRPFFFLGSVRREDVYAIGGNDEDFTHPGWDDNWFGDCLIHGRGLTPIYRNDVIGYHQDHPRPSNLAVRADLSRTLYVEKSTKAAHGLAKWEASSGPWDLDDPCQLKTRPTT